MANRARWSEHFVSLFNELKRRSHNDPNRLSWLVAKDESLRQIIMELENLTTHIDAALAASKHKYVPQVHPKFSDAFEAYKGRYEHPARTAYVSWLMKDIDFGPIDPSAKAIVKQEPASIETDEIVYREEFEPETDSFSRKLYGLVNYLWERLDSEEEGEFGDPNFANFLRVGLGAWDHAVKTIGIDLNAIESRWTKVPNTFVPQHVSDSHGLEETLSLYNLLDEARNAYVFGAPFAALAMCRALTEMILKEHYLPADRSSDLEALITVAEKRHPWIKRENLQAKRKLANKVLHGKRPSTKLTGKQDEAVRNYLVSIKRLIEGAPIIGSGDAA